MHFINLHLALIYPCTCKLLGESKRHRQYRNYSGSLHKSPCIKSLQESFYPAVSHHPSPYTFRILILFRISILSKSLYFLNPHSLESSPIEFLFPNFLLDQWGWELVGLCDMRICAFLCISGDRGLIWSNIYMGFSPAGGSSFDFFSIQSHCILSRPPTPVFLASFTI